MCVNFLTIASGQLREHFGADPGSAQWLAEAWQDYLAPILTRDGVRLASYGFLPKRHQPDGVRLSTTNARAETLGQLRTYRDAWHHGQLCLVPMRAFFEPSYESGRAVRMRIGLADGAPFAVAGLWREWQEADGSISTAFTQITINADPHPLMRRMHKPGDEKRMLVIVSPADYDAWLNCRDPEAARAFLQAWPAEQMTATPEATHPSRQGALF